MEEQEKKKIMLVDDEVGFTTLLRMNLEKTGRFEVSIENEAASAIASIRTAKPDLVLLDIVMPGKDGGDILAEMQDDATLSRIPVVMLTALVAREEMSADAVAQSEAMTVLPKPVELEKLMAVIESHLGE
ncbi:MAG: response regulator [Verrucomicrobiota bacterium]